MTGDEALIAQYVPLVDAELVRIGFTDDDVRYLASDGPLSPEQIEAHLADLRRIPAGIGANAYFARFGVDFAQLKRDADQPPTDLPPDER